MKFITAALMLLSLNIFAQVNRPGYCPMVESIPCEDLIMGQLHPREYDDANEYLEIRRSCVGNYGDSCLKHVMPYLSTFETDDRRELTSLAAGCKLTNIDCVEFVRTRISKFEFDDIREINQVTIACTRANVRCMERLCNTRQYRCNNSINLLNAARQCYTGCY